ncbi:MAG: Gfo/Idh/MocA family protein [Hoeflea sp.]|uniref:Gfo/Idh/MocA family protein n=1 Tax=Hoeflea sp. TaxID=1940281 RepID=UPI003EF232F6
MTQIGLIGFGRWGKFIFRDLRSIGVSVHVAVPSADSQNSARDAGAATVCSQAGDLPECDGYVVASSTAQHATCIAQIAQRGRPVFVEKPLTTDPASAHALASTLGGRLFVMDKWRYHPGVMRLAELAKTGALGEIEAIRTFRLGWGNPHKDVDALWILLPHDLSIALEILGYLPAADTTLSQRPGLSYEDLVVRLSDNTGGASVTVEISALHPASKRSVVVIGSKAVAQLTDSYDDDILLVSREQSGKPQRIQVGKDMPLLAELKAFVAHVEGGPPPKSSAAEGALIVQRIAELRAIAGLS